MVDTESIKYLLEDFDDDYDYDYQDEDEEQEKGIILRFLCIEKKYILHQVYLWLKINFNHQ